MKLTKIAVVAAALSVSSVVSSWAAGARADSEIKNVGDHPSYVVEAEPHALFGYDGVFGGGFGVGGRFSFPVVDNGFIKSINNSVAIGTGLDLLFPTGYYYNCGGACSGGGETVFAIPLVLQWNFYVAPKVSVFGEPGIEFQHRSFNACPPGARDCVEPDTNNFVPFVFYAGGRYHFNEHIAITGRFGFNTLGAGYFSVGVSFFL